MSGKKGGGGSYSMSRESFDFGREPDTTDKQDKRIENPNALMSEAEKDALAAKKAAVFQKYNNDYLDSGSFDKLGFNKAYVLSNNDKYDGNAQVVILVWNPQQVFGADAYRKAHYSDEIVDIAICQDPNVQEKQIGGKAIIYSS